MMNSLSVPMGIASLAGGPARPIDWDPVTSISPHAIIVGSSGTGKTYRLRYLINALLQKPQRPRIIILDVHGDIAPNVQNRVVFSETSNYGLNPLEIDLDADYGGVRRRINSFIDTLSRSTHALGPRQMAVLRELLEDLYRQNGYNPQKPETWNPATNPYVRGRSAKTLRHPGLEDLIHLTHWRMTNIATGIGSAAVRSLFELNRHAKRLHKMRNSKTEIDIDKLNKLKTSVKEAAIEYIDGIETGEELDSHLKFDSSDTLLAVYQRMKQLEACGVFKDAPPTFFESNPLRVYDIKALSHDEQTIFSTVLFERLFIEAKAGGISEEPHTFLIIDEAHKFMSNDKDHVLNRMSREIRKYGVGLILVSQSFDHFPEDLLANSAMTMILGMHDIHHEKASKKLGLDRKRLKAVKPQQTALIQIRHKARTQALSSEFLDLHLPRE